MQPPNSAPCVIFEDEHLLVVNKPAGWNTHSPSPYAGEGIYDWLRHREARWARLAIIHRLDKETSGVLVFGKSPLANKSLTEQFTARAVRKRYHLLTDKPVAEGILVVTSFLARSGERYRNIPGGEPAETHFQLLPHDASFPSSHLVGATPLTGRTHQIRAHAAESGFPILGDTLYGGAPFGRVCLHAFEISFIHPETKKAVTFNAPANFRENSTAALRRAIIDSSQTDAFRVIHGTSDRQTGLYVDKLGDHFLSQSTQALSTNQLEILDFLKSEYLKVREGGSVYHNILNKQVQSGGGEKSPHPVTGNRIPMVKILENGVSFSLSFDEGYSVGIFLDQRDNRRRFLTGQVAADFELGAWTPEGGLLNCFAYTCGFSVCAAMAGAQTTSLDLSKKYLDWGKANFSLNGLDAAQHSFISGDVFDWLKRFAKKRRLFDAIVLDPPTFSRSKTSGAFRAESDYGKLVAGAVSILKPGGVLLCSTNSKGLQPETFLDTIAAAIRDAKRKILKQHYVPQPPDFPISRDEPAYLKTCWLKIR